jgi:hypothetical protein
MVVTVSSKADAAFGQILQAAEQFIEAGEYGKVVIQGNRLMSLASLWSEDRSLVPVAVVMRLAANDIGFASAQDSKLDITQKQECERLLAGLRSLAGSPPVDPGAPWEEFAKFKQAFWSKAKGALEGRAYSPNPELVDTVLKWAASHLGSTAALVNSPRGSPFTGTVNDVDWVVRGFGANPRQAASYGLLCALAWQSEFERWKNSEQSEEEKDSTPGPTEFERLALKAVPLLDPATGDWAEIAAALDGLVALWRADISTYFDFIVYSQNQSSGGPEAEPEEEQRASRRGFRKHRGSRDS